MRLLVTGGAGFIGSNVIHRVIDEPEVKKLVNLDCLTYAGHLISLKKISHHPKYTFETCATKLPHYVCSSSTRSRT